MDPGDEESGKVLAEVSHDLANRFHRFHYYAEMLESSLESDPAGALGLLERIRATVDDVEELTRGTLSYVRPMKLHLLEVRMQDLVASLRQHAGEGALEVKAPAPALERRVKVDPSRISEVLSVLCRTAMERAATAAPLVLELVDGDPVAMQLAFASRDATPPELDLRLALAARIVRLHGGSLHVQGGDRPSLTLRLPSAGQEG